MSYFTTAVWYQYWMVIIIEEDPSSGCLRDERSRRNTDNLHDCGHLVVLILSSKYWHADKALEYDTAEAPHVDGRRVRNTQHDFWCSVEPRLNVSVESFELEAAASIINEFNLRLVRLHQKDVLRFQIAVHNGELKHVVERLQYLYGESFC